MVLDPRISPIFDLSDLQNDTSIYAAATTTEIATITAALNQLYADPNFFEHFLPTQSPLGSPPIIKVRLMDAPGQAFFAAAGQTFTVASNSVTFVNSTIGLSSDILAGIDAETIYGGMDNASFASILRHEIAHSVLTPQYVPGRYIEETANFIDNYYAKKNGEVTLEFMGHVANVPDSYISASAISYLDGYDMTSRGSLTSASDDLQFRFTDSGGNQINKIYYGEGHNGLDHLITIEAVASSFPVLNIQSGEFAQPEYDEIILNSLVEDVQMKINQISATRGALDNLIAQFEAISIDESLFDWILPIVSEFRNAFSISGPDTLLTVSAERFYEDLSPLDPLSVDILDVQGPVNSGAMSDANASAILRLDASGTMGTLIFGASGVTQLGVPGSRGVHLGGSTDLLVGGTGSDVLVLGDGVSSSGTSRNLAIGGSGTDVMVGSSHANVRGTLIGGGNDDWDGGYDIFVSGAGLDYIIGDWGGGDLVSYSGSTSGVTIDLSQSTTISFVDGDGQTIDANAFMGFGGDAQGDRYVDAEIFLGSATQANTFIGALDPSWSSHTFVGGAEADTFYLTNGDAAFGGGGADVFYIDSTEQYSNYHIYGLDAEDILMVDGVVYTGRTRTLDVHAIEDPDGILLGYEYNVTSDTSAWNPAYHSFGNQTYGPGISDQTRGEYLFYGHVGEPGDPGFGPEVGGPLSGTAQLTFFDYVSETALNVNLIGWEEGDLGINMSMENPSLDASTAGIWQSNGDDMFNGWRYNSGYGYSSMSDGPAEDASPFTIRQQMAYLGGGPENVYELALEEIGAGNRESDGRLFFASSAASDHEPLLAGITVQGPVAAGDTAVTVAPAPVTIAVLANDTDPANPSALTVSAVGAAANGTVAANPDGTLTYAPTAGFTGFDRFTYIAADAAGETDAASVTVQVAAANGGQQVAGDASGNTLPGGTGDDFVDAGDGSDFVNGLDGGDLILGGAGADYLAGGTGNDLIRGGAGADFMYGGAGDNRFVFGDGDLAADINATDQITGFRLFGADLLDLSEIDAVVGGRDDAFTFIGTGAFTGQAGELRYQASGAYTDIWGDVDGDGAADIALRLYGNVAVAQSMLIA